MVANASGVAKSPPDGYILLLATIAETVPGFNNTG